MRITADELERLRAESDAVVVLRSDDRKTSKMHSEPLRAVLRSGAAMRVRR